LLTPERWSCKEKLLVKWALRQCQGIICVSKAVAESARGFVSSHKLRVIYNGVPLSPPTLRENRAPRLLLCVARLAPEKGIATLIDAMRHLPENVVLNIAGEGSERARLTQQIQSNGLENRVMLLGEVSKTEIEKRLAQSDIFCQPSLQEGLGIAALEAMAAGLPVVASKVGGLIEVVTQSETGHLVPVGDARAFAHAIASLLKNPLKATQMGAAGRARVEKHFTREAMLAQTGQFYQEIVKQRLEGRTTA
jgi:glycosyltransferase involved in cell wall biosynthesis